MNFMWHSSRKSQILRIRYMQERSLNAAGEKFTTVVQIGIGGSDLGPRAMYIALENWAKEKRRIAKMEAKFISNVDPDDASCSFKIYRC